MDNYESSKKRIDVEPLTATPETVFAYRLFSICTTFLGISIHLYTVYKAYCIVDIGDALFTLILPYLIEAYWFRIFWIETNTFFNPYGVLILVYLLFAAIRFFVNRKRYLENIQFEKQYRSFINKINE